MLSNSLLLYSDWGCLANNIQFKGLAAAKETVRLGTLILMIRLLSSG